MCDKFSGNKRIQICNIAWRWHLQLWKSSSTCCPGLNSLLCVCWSAQVSNVHFCMLNIGPGLTSRQTDDLNQAGGLSLSIRFRVCTEQIYAHCSGCENGLMVSASAHSTTKRLTSKFIWRNLKKNTQFWLEGNLKLASLCWSRPPTCLQGNYVSWFMNIKCLSQPWKTGI